MSTSTVTIDTNEWKYPDRTGILHTVTNAETFTFTTTDDVGAAGQASYTLDVGQSVATDDGLTITMRPQGSIRILDYKDSEQGFAVRRSVGDWVMECPVSGEKQIWKCSSLNIDDADSPSTISATFEDQFANTFSWDAVDISTV